MNCVASLMQHALSSLWSPTLRQIGYILNAKKNVEDVSSNMEDLKAKRSDIQKAIEDAKREQKQSTHDVDRWLEKVGFIETEIATIVADFNRRGCLLPGGCSLNLWSSYQAGKLAAKQNAELEKLKTDGASLKDIVTMLPPVPVQEMPATSGAIGTGLKSNMEKIHAYLSEESVGIVGIWGMGGVGKSFLLRAVNNDFLRPARDGTEKLLSVDHVIWVVVSKELRLEKVQGDIAKRLGLHLPDPEDPQASATTIFNYLQDKDFLLLLDDLWEAVNLTDIGIPDLGNSRSNKIKRKVLFTTRFEKVCGAMHTQRSIKVECLKREEAWSLFRERAGEAVDVNPIKTYAEQIVDKCGGLPLALILLGQAMSIKKTSEEWNYALTSLQKSRADLFPGMEESVLTLKFSYDSLGNDTLRECFLCCALWPEDGDIYKEQLIEYWIGIGLIILDDFDDIGDAFDRGHFIIGLLKEACFLEDGKEDAEEFVKLHDVVRELALWIGSECGKKKNKWIVRAGAKFSEASLEMEKWSSADRVSLMLNGIEEFPRCPPQCPNLLLLILQLNASLKMLPQGFFQCMPALIFLDLSFTKLTELPRDISSLVNLQYLNLSNTQVASLPKELGSLVSLKYFILQYTSILLEMPSGLVSSLPLLQVLDLYPNVLMDTSEVNLLAGRIKALSISVSSLEMLQDVNNVAVRCLRICYLDENLTSLSLYLSNRPMWRGLQMLDISSCDELEQLVIIGNGHVNPLPRLEKLFLFELKELKQISWKSMVLSQCLQKLKEVTIWDCHGLKHLNWVLQLPGLVELTVRYCNGMEQLTGYDDMDHMVEESEQVTTEEVAAAAFSRLRKLSLHHLPNLRSISPHALAFPSLKTVGVWSCPRLKKLPLRPETSKKLQAITGGSEWWDGLEWDDEAIKSSISRYFKRDF